MSEDAQEGYSVPLWAHVPGGPVGGTLRSGGLARLPSFVGRGILACRAGASQQQRDLSKMAPL